MLFATVYSVFFISNFLLFLRLRRGLMAWFPESSPGRLQKLLAVFFLLVNGPLLIAAGMSWAGWSLEHIPEPLVHWFFYPSLAWLAMLVGYFLVAVPKGLLFGVGRGARWLSSYAASPFAKPRHEAAGSQPMLEESRAGQPEGGPASFFRSSPASRRRFLMRLAPAAPAALLGTAAYGVYGTKGDLDISPEVMIPIAGLPRELDGFRITQLSDLHFGPYIRSRDMEPVVETANALRSELIVITGDILDRSLHLLPEAAESLSRLQAPYGVYAILGNHDYYSDQRNPLTGYPGCNRLMEGLAPAGIRFLRNERASIRVRGAELLLAGLDWLGATRGDPNVYQQQWTRNALGKILGGSNPEAVRVLLAHHPHTFMEAEQFGIPLTLAGHTHGGGQVVLGQINGVPIGLGALRFRYISGLYKEGSRHLYVNRGIGYFGIPIRINCPPEISRFRLVRA
ncbi:MAG TPA: metallophosphoesterase [Bryobacterales bacterium]|jgi:predicted MPP superfamily phosphohydrolase|nr:metallophosphoesterase [Bryobacterales bacterium]